MATDVLASCKLASSFFDSRILKRAYVWQSWNKKYVKAYHTRYRAFCPELIPVYRQSARRWLGCYYFPPGLRLPSQPQRITALWPVSSYTTWWQRHIRLTYEQLAQDCFAAFASSRIWAHDLLIAISPTLSTRCAVALPGTIIDLRIYASLSHGVNNLGQVGSRVGMTNSPFYSVFCISTPIHCSRHCRLYMKYRCQWSVCVSVLSVCSAVTNTFSGGGLLQLQLFLSVIFNCVCHGRRHGNGRYGHGHTTFMSTMTTNGFGHSTFSHHAV